MKTLYFDCFSGISGDMTLGALLDASPHAEAVLREGLSAIGMEDYYDLVIEKRLKSGVLGTSVQVVEPGQHREHHHDHDDHGHDHAGHDHAEHSCDCGHDHAEHDHAEHSCDCGHDHGDHGEHGHDHAEHSCTCGHDHGEHNHDDSEHIHDDSEHNHDHEHNHEDDPNANRGLKEIRIIIEGGTLHPKVQETAMAIFTRLANAEAKIHGTTPDQVHFHEVGAIDAIVDIVGASILYHFYNPEQVVCSAVNLGSGYVKCEHGVFPVPAPAVAEILRGAPVYAGIGHGELTTPTGAAIVATLTTEYSKLPIMEIGSIGYGFGQREMESLNALRVYLGVAKNP